MVGPAPNNQCQIGRSSDAQGVPSIHHLQFHKPVGQQVQRSVHLARWRRATGHGNQPCFLRSLQLADIYPAGGAPVQGRLESWSPSSTYCLRTQLTAG